jgi:hypothetical protein
MSKLDELYAIATESGIKHPDTRPASVEMNEFVDMSATGKILLTKTMILGFQSGFRLDISDEKAGIRMTYVAVNGDTPAAMYSEWVNFDQAKQELTQFMVVSKFFHELESEEISGILIGLKRERIFGRTRYSDGAVGVDIIFVPKEKTFEIKVSMLDIPSLGEFCVYKATGDSPLSLVKGLLCSEFDKTISYLYHRLSDLNRFQCILRQR